ncbi:MAG: 16S rRNA (guanine(527)-N(7))-methyltransferase RsmG [Clostridiaceae bacterium]
MNYYQLLEIACKDINVTFDEIKYNQFIQYMNLLREWNTKINLTTLVEEEEIIKKHFIDSIKIFKYEKFKTFSKIIDVGTGAGFPGLPIKIIQPDMDVTLMDSLNKRVKFLDDVIDKADLKNVKTVHSRAEDGGNNPLYREKFDCCVSRAVANMAVLSEYCLPFVKIDGYFIALKGPAVEDELKVSEKAIDILGGVVESILPITVEETDLNHNLVIIKKIRKTPKNYPRDAGIVRKNPIK